MRTPASPRRIPRGRASAQPVLVGDLGVQSDRACSSQAPSGPALRRIHRALPAVAEPSGASSTGVRSRPSRTVSRVSGPGGRHRTTPRGPPASCQRHARVHPVDRLDRQLVGAQLVDEGQVSSAAARGAVRRAPRRSSCGIWRSGGGRRRSDVVRADDLADPRSAGSVTRSAVGGAVDGILPIGSPGSDSASVRPFASESPKQERLVAVAGSGRGGPVFAFRSCARGEDAARTLVHYLSPPRTPTISRGLPAIGERHAVDGETARRL